MQRFPREQFLILQGLGQESGEVEIAALAQRLEVDQALIAAGAQILRALRRIGRAALLITRPRYD